MRRPSGTGGCVFLAKRHQFVKRFSHIRRYMRKISDVFHCLGQSVGWKTLRGAPTLPQQCQHGFNLPTSTALITLAGAGAMLGMVPGLPTVPDPLSLASLPLCGAALWLRLRRENRAAARLRGLRLGVRLPTAPAALQDDVLVFGTAGTGLWRARRGGWQAEIRQTRGDPAWQLRLARLDRAEPPLPLTGAATLDALLRLAREILPAMADEPGLAGMLDCDLCFPLAGSAVQEGGITVLAEGGYALRGEDGCRAIAAEAAERLIRRGSAVPAAPF
jgi:hypothetical protein